MDTPRLWVLVGLTNDGDTANTGHNVEEERNVFIYLFITIIFCAFYGVAHRSDCVYEEMDTITALCSGNQRLASDKPGVVLSCLLLL